jgi:hypothetical protein
MSVWGVKVAGVDGLDEELPVSRAEPLPAHWDDLPWPRASPAAVVTVLAWALAPPVRPAAPVVGPVARRVARGGGLRSSRSRPAREVVGVEALPDYARVRASTGFAALSVEEFSDDDAFVTEMWLRAWVRRHRSPAVRAWLQAERPDLLPEVVTATAREVSVELALAVVDVGVLVVGLREGWDDEFTVAVMEVGFGVEEALALHARGDGWDVLHTMLALTGR